LKRIVLLITMALVVAAMVAASALSASAQQYAATSEQAGYCAPWSKEWNVSDGWWYFDWYR
jgi:Ni/Co efflux regulator RcnB